MVCFFPFLDLFSILHVNNSSTSCISCSMFYLFFWAKKTLRLLFSPRFVTLLSLALPEVRHGIALCYNGDKKRLYWTLYIHSTKVNSKRHLAQHFNTPFFSNHRNTYNELPQELLDPQVTHLFRKNNTREPASSPRPQPLQLLEYKWWNTCDLFSWSQKHSHNKDPYRMNIAMESSSLCEKTR